MIYYKFEKSRDTVADFSSVLKHDREIERKTAFVTTFHSAYDIYLRDVRKYFYLTMRNVTILFCHRRNQNTKDKSFTPMKSSGKSSSAHKTQSQLSFQSNSYEDFAMIATTNSDFVKMISKSGKYSAYASF